jgi:UDP-3-O-[3-hydroxymyristoyl] glucosamine N-acyltransferase
MNWIHPDATIEPCVKLGDGIWIDAGARLGTQPIIVEKEPFTFENRLVPCEKGVIVEDNVYIGANTVIPRGYKADTTIKRGAHIGNTCVIGHDVYVGENTVISPLTVICGHTIIEPQVVIKAGVTIFENLRIGAFSLIGADSTVTRSVPQGTYGYGSPFKPKGEKNEDI